MNKAIVLIEFQNEWLSPDGSLYSHIEKGLKERDTIHKTLELLAIARKNNFMIIHAPLVYKNNYLEISDFREGLVKAVKKNQRFNCQSKNSEIPELFTPQKEDIVIGGRIGTSCFSGSNLDLILRANGITELYFAGFITEVCVLSTLIDSYNRGYLCRLLSDCTLSPEAEAQSYTEKLVNKHFGKVISNQDFKFMDIIH